ncbi:hypothetical protein Dda_2132 [Drechslerella dactyloides]|uniref:Uncharacterized protein n=1 Tax=Drechslerella dactyloides TaxID=74499 RepID=A0AAD6J349_DREDA|nr:hypothetical protein Dda_2132 [Drechslerella dactyloides]
MSSLNPRAEGPSSPPPLYAAVSGLKTPPPNGRAGLYNGGNSVSPRRGKGGTYRCFWRDPVPVDCATVFVPVVI